MDFPVADVSLPPNFESPSALVEIKEMRGTIKDDFEGETAGGIRYKAIRQEGMRVGAQTGLAYRYSMVMARLNKKEPELNVTFNFAGFVRDGRLLVPAIEEVRDKFVMDEETGEARVIRQAITVSEEARIISVVPTWRDYIWQEYSYPEKPHISLLPRTDKETQIWQSAVDEGWRAGVSQADAIYSDRLAMLTKAVEGRHLYNTMESKNVFTAAALNVAANKVTFNGRTMNVGEVIYTIRDAAGFRNAKAWSPVWTRQ